MEIEKDIHGQTSNIQHKSGKCCNLEEMLDRSLSVICFMLCRNHTNDHA